MIEELLKTVAQGGIHSYDELAERLSISQALLEMMLQDLARLGYLRAVGSSCDHLCASCPIGSCSVAGPRRLWSLTEKGARAAAADRNG